MKKFLVVLLSIFSFVAIWANTVSAESTNIISNGDFEGMLVDGEDTPLTETVNNGFGSGSWDSYATVTKDPLNADNTVLKFSYTVEGKGFSSFFKFCTVEANTTYDISFKYLVVGETDNFGMRFAGQTIVPEKTFYSGSATDGWQEASFQLTTVEDGVYDSIGMWFSTKSNTANAGYVDDIVITKVEETEEVESIISNGDFEGMLVGEEDTPLSETLNNGYGSGSWDSYAVVTKDPLDASNTVVKFSYTVEGKAFSSFFKFCTVEANTTYNISFKYLVVGETDNFGMRFAGQTTKPEYTFYSGSATDGWQEASFQLTTAEDGVYDSIGVWFNSKSNAANAGYMDDIVITKVEAAEEEPVISKGDFEGLLNDGNDVALSEVVNNGYGSGSWDSNAIITKDPLDASNTVLKLSYTVEGKAFASFFKFCTLKPNTTYQIDLDYMVVGSTDNFGMRFAPDVPKLETTFYDGGATDGWQHATWEWTTDKDSSYDSIGVWFNTGSSLDNVGYVDNIVVTMVEEVTPEPEPEVENPFDPNKTYYQSESMTVNGDFEKFAVGTVFSEEQQEGAWGSVSLDNPATIQEVDGSHVIDLTAGAKVYSSAFLMMPDTLEVGDLLRLTYDVKLVLSDEAASYTAIDSCLVGGSNISYYTINYKSLDFASEANKTSGEELLNYPITVTAKENGWYTVSFDFQLTSRDLIQTNSLRFLFTAKSAEDHMYVDNVNLYTLSETPFDTSVAVESIAFNDGASVNMTVGDEKTLGYTINPTDATDKSVTFASSNESVATVDANGKVVAVGKGACTVTVTAANGVKAEIAVLVSEATTQTPASGCLGSVGASLLGVIALAGAAFVVAKRKKD